MAIEHLQQDVLEESPRPALRLITSVPASPYRTGRDVSARRHARREMMLRRRRSLLVGGVVATIVVLAWPGHAFGGVSNDGVLQDQASSGSLAAGSVYIVHEGDTVSSIARLVNSSNPTPARSAIIQELGSSVVVPGEHITIP